MKHLKNYFFVEMKEDDSLGFQGQIMECLEGDYFLVDIFDWLVGEHSYSRIIHGDFFLRCRLFKDQEHFKNHNHELMERDLERARRETLRNNES